MIANDDTYTLGDIVLVLFPYSDGERSKKRPAIVLKSENVDNPHKEQILAMITSKVQKYEKTNYRILIDPNTEIGGKTGLPQISLIVLDKMTCVKCSAIDKRLGNLPITSEVKSALCEVFGLSISN